MQFPERKSIIETLILVLAQTAAIYAITKLIPFPFSQKQKDLKDKSKKMLSLYGKENLGIDEYEIVISSELIHPSQIDTKFESIAGLDEIINDLKETVIMPLKHPDLFKNHSDLVSPPKGVLLYGPPGCGKTMIAKALAKESGASFINMKVSTLADKWYGESNKLVHALFSLANKLQPCIIFIDEIDAFLRERRSSDHEVTSNIKAEFMSLWDGLQTEEDNKVLILGATNRPHDIDSAIMRRMPKQFLVKLPNISQRKELVELFLKGSNLEDNFDYDSIAEITENYSGSDLKEMCRSSALIPIRECMKDVDPLSNDLGELKPRVLRASDCASVVLKNSIVS